MLKQMFTLLLSLNDHRHDMRKCLGIRVFGKVQGVFFRASTKEQADALHIVGKVKNESDGTVSIEACGEEEVINTFLEWCKHGPRNARVDKLEVTQLTDKNYHKFFIER